MFRTAYVHLREGYIVLATLYGAFFVHLCQQSGGLGYYLEHILQQTRINFEKRNFITIYTPIFRISSGLLLINNQV
jgi:hypothetical protein